MINDKYPTTKPSLNLDFANTKSLDPRINFRRGTPGTYYDGVTYVKAEENLIDYSEDFSQWSYDRIVQTSGQSAPDGSSTAYKIEQESGQTTGGYLFIDSGMYISGFNYVWSVYAKAGTNRNYLALRSYFGEAVYTFFDLVNGLVANPAKQHSADISDAGNGWYRCSIMFFAEFGQSFSSFAPIYFSDNDSSITVADDGGFIYLWGAQLEQRDSVTSYTATNGTPITKYQPKLMTASPDDARFDHDPITGESKGLLIEEQRTNLVQESEDISHLIEQNVLIEHNTMIAPDGTSTADKIVANSGTVTNNRIYSSNYNLSDNEEYTLSFYAKKGEMRHVYAELWDSTGNSLPDSQVWFNLLTGEFNLLKGLSANMEELGNGWYRCSVSSTNDASTDANSIRIQLGGNSSGPSSQIQGDGYSGLYIWGLQLEKGSFPTSYIKSSGASAGTVRSADNASITGENFSSWYRQDEGSLYSEISTFDYRTGLSRITISDGTNNNRILMANSGNYFLLTDSAGTRSVYRHGPTADGNYHKKSYGFKKDNFSACYDGSLSLDSIDGKMPLKVDTICFHDPVGSDDYINGHIKKLAYYPQRLTNEQLQNLTK